MLPFDHGSVSAESLPALLADEISCAKRLIQLRLRENAVVAEAPPEPCSEGLLVGEGIRSYCWGAFNITFAVWRL